jgi:hypothetical protein
MSIIPGIYDYPSESKPGNIQMYTTRDRGQPLITDWHKPQGPYRRIFVALIASGGSGASGSTGASNVIRCGGGGGAAGACSWLDADYDYFPGKVTITMDVPQIPGAGVSGNTSAGNSASAAPFQLGVASSISYLDRFLGTGPLIMLSAAKGSGGSGATTSAGGSGGAQGGGHVNGLAGGAGSSGIAIGSAGSGSVAGNSAPACGGGGGGGGVTTGGVVLAGGNSSDMTVGGPSTVASGLGGTADGDNGTSGLIQTLGIIGLRVGGSGGGGGAGGVTNNGGNGGDGAFPGGGGGGGGGATNGKTSGAGGKGADGLVVIYCY